MSEPGPKPSALKALNYLVLTLETNGFYQIEIIINALVCSFCFILIPMSWVYEHSKYFNILSGGIIFRRQILTSKDGPHAERVKPSRCIRV